MNNFLAGLAGFASGGLDAYNNATVEQRKREQAQLDEQYRRDQMRRAIVNDQRDAAHQQAMEQQAAAQVASLEDQRKFNAGMELAKSGYMGTMTADQVGMLHPTVRAIATEEVERPPLANLPQVATQGLDGTISAPDPNAPPEFRFKDTNSERMQIAALNNQRILANQQSNENYRRDKMGQDRDLALMRAIASSGRRGEMTPNQRINLARSLGNDYQRNTKAERTVLGQFQLMQDAMTALDKGSDIRGLRDAAGQPILVTFQKILDPTSVVRESEYGRSIEGQALADRLWATGNQLLNGGVAVTDDQLRSYVNMARQFAQRSAESARAEKARIGFMADDAGIDRRMIFADDSAMTAGLSGLGPQPQQAPATPASAPVAAPAPGNRPRIVSVTRVP